MRNQLIGAGWASMFWAVGALYLQLAKTTILMWGGPGDAAGAVIMGAIVLVIIAMVLMSPRARDTLTVGALLILWAAIWARASWA